MGWIVTFDDDHVVDLTDLKPATFDEIAKLFPSKNGFGIYQYPLPSFAVAHAVVVAAAEVAGISPPPFPEDMRAGQDLYDMFSLSDDDDRPKVGTPPESPKPEDDPETT